MANILLAFCMPISSTPIGAPKPLNFRMSVGGERAPRFSLLSDERSIILPENDDEAEIKRKREEKALERERSIARKESSLSRRKSLVQSSRDSLLADAQKREHIQLCMKLTSENKVNAKNAFGLHLIEYMYEMVKKSSKVPNFQMASMTLMASAKLYGLRVDTLHANTLKVADTLSIPIRKRAGIHINDSGTVCVESEQENSDGNGVDDESDVTARPKKLKAKKLKCQIAKNAGVIDEEFDIEEEPHEKYQKIVGIFEDEEVSLMGTTFCHLSVLADSGKIALADKAMTYISEKKQPFPVKKINVSSLKKYFARTRSPARTHQKCFPTLSMYSLNDCKWPLDSNNILPRKDSPGREKLAKYLTVGPEFEKMCMQPYTQTVAFTEGACKNDGENEDISFERAADADFPGGSFDAMRNATLISAVQQRPSSARFTGTIPPALPYESRLTVKSLTSCLPPPNTVSEYSALDPVLEAAILGRKTIKERAATKREPSGLTKNTEKEKPKQPFKFSFESPEPQFMKERLHHVGNQITVSDQAQAEWIVENTTLPVLIYDPKNTGKLFLKPHLLRKPQKAVILNKSIGAYDYNNPLDREFCVENKIDSYSSDGSGYDNDQRDDREKEETDVLETSLAAEPVQVKRDVISYAKVAKYINQAEVKTALWTIIKDDFDRMEKPEDMPVVDISSVDFIGVYERLKNVLPADTVENVSIPIAFSALLQIVNDKALCLKNTSRLVKLFIMPSKSA